MLTKLAFKNVGKNIKDFTVYFFTLAFGVCVFYMFNSIYAQQAMFDMTEEKTQSVTAICEVLSYVSGFVAVVLGFLVVYANGFFVKRRKKELGIYMTLGMGKSKISLILVLETSVIAIAALVVGILGGVFLSQFMSVFTAKLFEVDMTSFQFVFSFDAMLKSIIYFGIIFLVVIVFNVILVSRFKLIDLIYAERKNQNLKIRNTKINAILCILSMIILGVAYYLIIDNGMLYINEKFLTAIILGIIGTVLFFFSLSGLLTVLISRSKKLYYKNLNMFVVRQLGSNINTNFISVSVVSIVLLLTIGVFSSGYGLQTVFNDMLRNMASFEYSFQSNIVYKGEQSDFINTDYPEAMYEMYSQNDLADFEKFISKNEYVKDYAICNQYYADVTYADFGVELPEGFEMMNDQTVLIVSVSDYNKAMRLIGNEELTLDDGQYALLSNYSIIDSYFQSVQQANSKLKVGGKTLSPAKWINGAVCDVGAGNLIVPDEIAQQMKTTRPYYQILNVSLKDETKEKEFEHQFNEYHEKYAEDNNYEKSLFMTFYSKTEIYNGSVTTKALLSFLAIYLGIVFMVTCTAILAIQQLTQANENKSRYELLSKLGADRKMLNKALFIQILCYFIFPLLLGVVHSVFGLIAVQKTLAEIALIDIGTTLLPTGLFVDVLYTAYFLLTYFSSKTIIHKK
ncbi:MAG: FtsX-like permease family protein [Acutalibacteraceae bacterium]